MNTIELLVLVARFIDLMIEKAAERQKAGNLETLQAAIDQGKKARTKDEAINANKALRDALAKR